MFYKIAIFQIIIFIVSIVGWVWNIIKITQHDFSDPITAMIVLRVVGIIVAPLGVVMGYIP